MLIPDKSYSIFGFINTWKLSHKYIILHYLSVWNVGWSSYHVGCIVQTNHNASASPKKSVVYNENWTLNLSNGDTSACLPLYHSATQWSLVMVHLMILLPNWAVFTSHKLQQHDLAPQMLSHPSINHHWHIVIHLPTNPPQNHANHPCYHTQQEISPITAQITSQIGFINPQMCHVIAWKGQLKESKARWGRGR